MTQAEIRHLSFSQILDNITLSIRQGDYIILCGANGSGKTTLLRHLKPSLTPPGERSGEVLINGIPAGSLSRRDEVSLIGMCMQSPEDQIVTDRVWHEIAFGLESLGTDQDVMRRRVQETASFFGIEDLLDRNTADLSGGQKQIVNLASVLASGPQILLLDEPTSRLDPEASAVFLGLVEKINRELGTTVIIAEQRLEKLLPAAGRVIMLERGRVVKDCSAGEFSNPFVMSPGGPVPESETSPVPAVSVSDAFFRYEKDGPDILKGLSFSVPGGSICAVTGKNGCGKTTLLKTLCGLLKLRSGDAALAGRAALLPQSARDVFVRKTLRDDLMTAARLYCAESDLSAQFTSTAELCRISHLLDHHPYDLSGGEMQRAAIAMLLITGADILLLDEPTKGLDTPSKEDLADLLISLKGRGRTLILVSHDSEFCTVCADRAVLMADGRIAKTGAPKEIFDRAGSPAAQSVIPEPLTASGKLRRSASGPDSRSVSGQARSCRLSASMLILTAAMTLLAVLVRAAFIMTPHIRPMAAIVMIAGICLGPWSGLVSGALAAYLSNFIVGGQGPWTVWQMGAFALAGLVMGLLAVKGVLDPAKRLPVSLTGGLLILLVIGPLLDTSSLFTGISGADPAAVYMAGLPVNLAHAGATAVALFILCKPFYEKIERYRRKSGI